MAEIRELSNAEYHSGEGVSSSDLKLLLRSPYHYHKKEAKAETPSMKLGTAVHCAVFEPDRFKEDYIEAPKLDKRTKAGKELWAQIEAGGKIPLTADEMASVRGMVDAIKSHKFAGKLVTGGVAEQSVFWNEGDMLCKCRPDYVKDLADGYLIIDLKTTRDAREHAFTSASFWDYQYHISAAHYIRGMTALRGIPPKGFIFVAVENTHPYGVNVYQAGADFLKIGDEECRTLYDLYSKCAAEDNWPCYEESIKTLETPFKSKEAV